jgi:hypothetical protein
LHTLFILDDGIVGGYFDNLNQTKETLKINQLLPRHVLRI